MVKLRWRLDPLGRCREVVRSAFEGILFLPYLGLKYTFFKSPQSRLAQCILVRVPYYRMPCTMFFYPRFTDIVYGD